MIEELPAPGRDFDWSAQFPDDLSDHDWKDGTFLPEKRGRRRGHPMHSWVFSGWVGKRHCRIWVDYESYRLQWAASDFLTVDNARPAGIPLSRITGSSHRHSPIRRFFSGESGRAFSVTWMEGGVEKEEKRETFKLPHQNDAAALENEMATALNVFEALNSLPARPAELTFTGWDGLCRGFPHRRSSPSVAAEALTELETRGQAMRVGDPEMPTWVRVLPNYERDLAALRRYIEREGHCRMRTSHVETVDGEAIKLGHWTYDRRNDFHFGTLSTKQVADLEALPGWDWEYRYSPMP